MTFLAVLAHPAGGFMSAATSSGWHPELPSGSTLSRGDARFAGLRRPSTLAGTVVFAAAMLQGILLCGIYKVGGDAGPASLVSASAYGGCAGCLFFILKRFIFMPRPQAVGGFASSFVPSLQAVAVTSVTLVMLAFLSDRIEALPRGVFVNWLELSALLAALIDLGVARLFGTGRVRGDNLFAYRVAVVGCGDLVDAVVGNITQGTGDPPRIVETVRIEPDSALHRSDLDLAAIVDLARTKAVDEVVIAFPWSEERVIRRVVGRLAPFAAGLSLYPDRLVSTLGAMTVGASGLASMTLLRPSIDPWAASAKIVFDRIAALLLLALAGPVLGLIALAVRLDSRGPVFFRQPRHGLNDDVFIIWKFRTMRHQRPDAGGVYRQAKRGDDRVTRVGRLLRMSSLDELPQLFNVVLGHMSLVGPRPHPLPLDERFVERIAFYAARYRVRPGITGLAQINGYRGETDSEEKMVGRIRHDLTYIRSWSLLLDLKILLLTPFKGFIHPNAY